MSITSPLLLFKLKLNIVYLVEDHVTLNYIDFQSAMWLFRYEYDVFLQNLDSDSSGFLKCDHFLVHTNSVLLSNGVNGTAIRMRDNEVFVFLCFNNGA